MYAGKQCWLNVFRQILRNRIPITPERQNHFSDKKGHHMTLTVVCECGSKYSVDEQYSGSVFQCENCGRRLVARTPPTIVEYDQTKEQQILKEVHASQEASHTRASNPGMMQISRFRYARAFPKWSIVLHGGLLISLGLLIVSWWFLPLPLIFGWLISTYWSRVTAEFKSGCVNPSQIVSLDPPLVAVYTDLRLGPHSLCPVIKILPQAIHKMIDGPAEVDRRVVTVACYQRGPEVLDHWSDFYPKLANAVAADQLSLTRTLQSIKAEEWRKLEKGIEQLPRPFKAGTYRIHKPSSRPPAALDESLVIHQIDSYLNGLHYVKFMSETKSVPKEILSQVPEIAHDSIYAVIESAAVSADRSEVMCLTPTTVYGSFGKTGHFKFEWKDLIAAFDAGNVLRLTRRDLTYIEIPRKHYLSKLGAGFEMMCTSIINRSPA